MDEFVSSGLSAATEEKARVELNETEDVRLAALQELRNVLPEHLAEKDDGRLTTFLRVAKYDVGKASARLLSYDKFRKENPDFDGIELDEILPVLEAGIVVVPKKRDQHGRRVLIFNYSRWDTGKIQLPQIQRAIVYLLEVFRADEETQVNGSVFLQDLADYSFSHAYQYTPALLRRALAGTQCMPSRLAAGVFVHEPFYYSLLWKLCKPLMSEKLRSRMLFYGSDHAAVHKTVAAECLPAYFGGSGNEDEMIRELVEFVRDHGTLPHW